MLLSGLSGSRHQSKKIASFSSVRPLDLLPWLFQCPSEEHRVCLRSKHFHTLEVLNLSKGITPHSELRLEGNTGPPVVRSHNSYASLPLPLLPAPKAGASLLVLQICIRFKFFLCSESLTLPIKAQAIQLQKPGRPSLFSLHSEVKNNSKVVPTEKL